MFISSSERRTNQKTIQQMKIQVKQEAAEMDWNITESQANQDQR